MAEFHGRQVLKAAPDKSIEFCHVLKQQFLLSDDDVGCCFHSILSEPEFIELKNCQNVCVDKREIVTERNSFRVNPANPLVLSIPVQQPELSI